MPDRNRAARPKRRRLPLRLEVLRTERLTPHMQRVYAGGAGFADFVARNNEFTDRYVKVVFCADGVDYPEPLDLDAIQQTLPAEHWPVVRTYTVRSVDVAAGELAIDFVVHGDEGVAGPWAVGVQPGAPMYVMGPGGAYRPDPDADWHLLAGDEAALPAIAAALESMPAGALVHAFVEVDSPAEEQPIDSAADVRLTWLHRNGAPAGTTTLLPDAVRALEWPVGRVQAFVHGEASLLKTVRPYLLSDREVARSDVSISGYWRNGDDEPAFRVWKSQQAKEPAPVG